MPLFLVNAKERIQAVAPWFAINLYRDIRKRLLASLVRVVGSCQSCICFVEPKPIFIVGSEHSGTTLMISILSRHPNLWAVPVETNVFSTNISKTSKHRQLLELIGRMNESGARRFVEKTPGHIRFISQIFRWFPAAKVVVMLRDGRDVAVSYKRRSGRFKRAVKFWVEDSKYVFSHADDKRVLVVKYERLVAEPKRTVERLCEFIGERYDPRLLDTRITFRFHDNEELAAPASAYGEENHIAVRKWQINQPIYDDSGRWMAEMLPLEARYFERKAGGTLVALGYEQSNYWRRRINDFARSETGTRRHR